MHAPVPKEKSPDTHFFTVFKTNRQNSIISMGHRASSPTADCGSAPAAADRKVRDRKEKGRVKDQKDKDRKEKSRKRKDKDRKDKDKDRKRKDKDRKDAKVSKDKKRHRSRGGGVGRKVDTSTQLNQESESQVNKAFI